MNYFEIELKNRDGETSTYRFRMTSAIALSVEKQTGQKMLDYMRDYSMTTVVNLIRNMLKWEKPNISEAEACEVYDMLVDNGYTLERVLTDVIYEGLSASGFLAHEDLVGMKKELNEKKENKSQVPLQK